MLLPVYWLISPMHYLKFKLVDKTGVPVNVDESMECQRLVSLNLRSKRETNPGLA